MSAVGDVDRATVLHPFTVLRDHRSGLSAGPQVIASGSGIRVTDVDGRELIDGFAGLYCVNVGYGRQEVVDAMERQARKLPFFHAYAGHTTEELARLSERLVAMAPGRASKVFYGTSGSDANDTQIKLVWYYNNLLGRPERKKIISRRRGYHGCTIGAGSLTGMSFYHALFDLPLDFVRHTTAPYYFGEGAPGESEIEFGARCAADLRRLIEEEGPETVAAFIAEPILGTGGLVPPPEGYWPAIQAVLREYDVLLIADEVVTGFGRTGAMFGSDLYAIDPDLVTLAKGLTSAYVPMSATVVGERVYEVLETAADIVGAFSHGYTYSGHPLAAAAANAVLDIVETEDLAGNARDVGEYFLAQLQERLAAEPFVGDVRGVGLLAAIEFVADKERRLRFEPELKVGKRVAQAALDRGLIARAMPDGEILGFAPPLVTTCNDVDAIVERTIDAIRAVSRSLARDVQNAQVARP
jgi:L-2,4-diaminobutyrate transaminase